MIDNVTFLFPGQGAQYPEMGLDFYKEQSVENVQNLFELASEVFGRDMAELLRNATPDELKRTDVSQPAITLVNLAAAAYLAEKGIKPSACAGFSLGEYAALSVAGVFSAKDCFFLINERGKAMQAAIDNIQSSAGDGLAPGMAAVIGLDAGQVEALIAEWKIKETSVSDLYAANINSSKQVVVSGSAAALDEAEKRFKDSGARRVIRLQVAGPFHSPLMKDAADAFAPALEKVTFNDPVIPVFSNVTGKLITSGAHAKELALWHIIESVRWTDEQAALAALQPNVLLEVGPGKVLQGLWKDTGSEVPCCTAGTIIEINKFLEEV